MLLICISHPAIPSSLFLAKHLPIHSTSTGSTFMPQRYVTKEINCIGKKRQMVRIPYAVHGGPLTCSCASLLTPSLLSCSSFLFSSSLSLPTQTRGEGSDLYYQSIVDRERVAVVEGWVAWGQDIH